MVLETFRLANDFTWDRANGIVFDDVIVNQGDANGRKMRVQVVNRGAVENLTGAGLNLAWKATNGKGLDKFTVVNATQGIFEISFTKGMLANVGRINASLQLILPSAGGIVESRPFVISNQASVVDQDSAQSTDSWTALETALANAEDLEANYTPKLFSLEQQLVETVTDVKEQAYNIRWSALEVVNGDWTNAINNALKNHNHVFIPKMTGDTLVYGTIDIPARKTLELGEGAKLRKPADATNTDPVIWMKNSYSKLIGTQRVASTVKSEKESPLGVVALGYLGMGDTTGKNVLYSTIRDIGISGHRAGGNTTGNLSIGLLLANPQVNDLASYFHDIHHIYIEHVNSGLVLEGWANANIIGDIQFINVGTNKQLGGGAIHLKNTGGKGPMDNVITNIFHHYSSGADTLLLDGYCHYNVMTGINSEQGGASARWVVAPVKEGQNTPMGNIISGIANVAGGFLMGDEFYGKNTVIQTSSINSGVGSFRQLTAKENVVTPAIDATLKTSARTMENDFDSGFYTENKSYKLLEFDFTNTKGNGGTIEIDVSTKGNTDAFIHQYSIKFAVRILLTGAVTVTDIYRYTSLTNGLTVTVEGSKVIVGIKTGNNGTTNSTIAGRTNYKVRGEISRSPITEHKTPVLIA